MTAQGSARNDHPFPCPHCAYRMDTAGSLPAHVAMAHPEVPMDAIAPRRAAGGTITPGVTYEISAAEAAAGGWIEAERALPGAAPAAGGATLAELPLDLVDVGLNVRVNVDEIEELAASIREHGVLQPIKATGPHADGRYLVTWGQRRTLASRLAERETILAFVLPPSAEVDHPGAARSIEQLVENLHRADLNPVDRARAMQAVVGSGVSQADLARQLGIAPSTVSNDLRLLTLADDVVERIRTGEITASHGKAIASLPAKQQREIAERIARDKVSTKDLERELEWKRQEAEADEARAKRTDKLIPKAIAALEGAAVPRDVQIGVTGGGYNLDGAKVEKALRAAGWTEITNRYHGPRPTAGKCDCTSVRLELDGRSPKIVPACADTRHQDRQRNIDREAEDAARKAYAARQVAVQREVERQLRAANLHPLVLELIDKAVGAYHDARTVAERDVVGGLALAIVQTWRVREAITPELLAELGIAEPAEAAEAAEASA